MENQEKAFQTVSHCLDLEKENKKVLVSVSICHINRCDGCDPSGEKGLHKATCAWNILSNESQVHEVKSSLCPLHDAIYNNHCESKESTPDITSLWNEDDEVSTDQESPDSDFSAEKTPLFEANPYNIQPVLSSNNYTKLTFDDLQRQNENSTCSYVYVDKLDAHFSSKLPKIITEALASSAILEGDQSVLDSQYEPYQKITALTLDKIQELKNKILNSSETTTQSSTDVYKIQSKDSVYVMKQTNQELFHTVSIENPNDCEIERNIFCNTVQNTNTLAYECCYSNGFDLELQNITIGDDEEVFINLKNSHNILNNPLTEIFTREKMNVNNKPLRLPYLTIDQQKPENKVQKILVSPKTMDIINSLNEKQINDILTIQDTLKNIKRPKEECRCGKNCGKKEGVNQKIQTEDDEDDKYDANKQNSIEILSNCLQKVKKSAAEMSDFLKQQETLIKSVKNEQRPYVSRYKLKRMPRRQLDYGSKLVLSPQIESDMMGEGRDLLESEEKLKILKPYGFLKCYHNILQNSSLLKSLIPPMSTNGLFSDAVDSHIQEKKHSLIPWIVRMFIPTCECTDKGGEKQK